MNKIFISVISILPFFLLSSCDFLKSASTYKETTENFIESILEEDYEKAIEYMATEHEDSKNINLDTLKAGLANIRQVLIKNFGSELDFSFMEANKTWSSNEEERTKANMTEAQIQISNEKEFGVLEIMFDDKTDKIYNIRLLDIKEKVPNMLNFWLFGLVAIWIPIFNIWVIRKIKKSDLNRKWLRYLAVIFLNVPAVIYNAVHGLSIDFLNFQILFGISFSYMGYLGSTWSFGIPLGGIYWFWKLKKKSSNTEAVTKDETPIE